MCACGTTFRALQLSLPSSATGTWPGELDALPFSLSLIQGTFVSGAGVQEVAGWCQITRSRWSPSACWRERTLRKISTFFCSQGWPYVSTWQTAEEALGNSRQLCLHGAKATSREDRFSPANVVHTQNKTTKQSKHSKEILHGGCREAFFVKTVIADRLSLDETLGFWVIQDLVMNWGRHSKCKCSLGAHNFTGRLMRI